jgi:hypothetical protein
MQNNKAKPVQINYKVNTCDGGLMAELQFLWIETIEVGYEGYDVASCGGEYNRVIKGQSKEIASSWLREIGWQRRV